MAKQDRAVRTRRELIRSAAEAFDQYGYAPSSLADISARAGVSTGALHFHFRNKRELGAAVESTAVESLRCVTAVCPAVRSAPLQVLVDVTHLLARQLTQDVVLRAGFGLGNDATWRSEGRVTLWLEWRNWVGKVLAAAGREGNLAADVVQDQAGVVVTAAVVGFEVLGRSDEEWLARSAVTRFWELMLPRLSAESMRGDLDAGGSGVLRLSAGGVGEWICPGGGVEGAGCCGDGVGVDRLVPSVPSVPTVPS